MPWRVDSLITPDHGAPGYRAYVVDVLTSWLDRGVAGFRLDSAWSMPPGFWRAVLAAVRRRHPDAWFLGQVFDDDLAPVVNSTTLSAATEYALMHGVREWLPGGPDAVMAAALGVHRRNASGRTAPHTFLGNHDFARLADTVPGWELPLGFAILLTVPGRPGIYYGDEAGITSTWTEAGSDALLRPPSTPADVTAAAPGLLAEVGGTRPVPSRPPLADHRAARRHHGRGSTLPRASRPLRSVVPGRTRCRHKIRATGRTRAALHVWALFRGS